MTRAAIYVRQSEDKSGHEAAIHRQETDCRLLAQAKGWELPTLYADNSISASNGKTRPDFERLIRDVESGNIKAVAVWHLDRLTRSMRDLSRIIDAGKSHRVNIASVHGVSLDLGDPTGVAVAQILTAIAAMETAHKGQRQKRANRQRAEKGTAFWSRRPFGYDRDASGNVFVVTAEAEAIREGAAAVLQGDTLSSVARAWMSKGLRTTDVRRNKETSEVTKSGGAWGVTQVRRVFLNPRYAGTRLYNGEDMGEGDWEAILTVDVMKDLEILLTDPRRRTAPDDLNSKHLLSGIATCGKCGKKMFAAPYKAKGRELLVYRCFGGYCMQRNKELVDEVVERAVIVRLSQPDAVQLFNRSTDTRALRSKADDLRSRRDSLAALLAEGLLSPAAVRQQATKISNDLHDVENKITAANGMHPAAGIVGAPDVGGAWRAASMTDQRRLIRSIMSISILPAGKGIRFSPEQVKITWRNEL